MKSPAASDVQLGGIVVGLLYINHPLKRLIVRDAERTTGRRIAKELSEMRLSLEGERNFARVWLVREVRQDVLGIGGVVTKTTSGCGLTIAPVVGKPYAHVPETNPAVTRTLMTIVLMESPTVRAASTALTDSQSARIIA